MIRYTFSRLWAGILLIFLLVTAVFFMLQLAPGDPVQTMIGGYPVSDEYRASMEERYGFDKPVWERYWNYLVGVVQLDLGYSFSQNADIATLVLDRMQNTLILTMTSFLISAVVGIGIGIVAAMFRGTSVDSAASLFALVGFSFPSFFLGQLLILTFAVNLGWFPVSGMSAGFGNEAKSFGDLAWHLVLPAIALAVRDLGLNARITRASLAQTIGQDYMLTARSKGLTRKRTILRHGLKNSLLPVVTTLGFNFGSIVAGSVLIETVFAWPGMGRMMYEAIMARDTMVIIAGVMLIAAIVVIVNIVTDILYSFLDPRIRTEQ